jgi:hypothetical protein
MKKLGWDFEKFKRAYDEDPGMRGRRSRGPSADEIHAVEQFLKAGDFAALKKALQTENLQTANAAVARVVAHKAQQKRGRDAEGA